MERREALRLLATGTALQLAPTNLLAVLRRARGLLDTQGSPRTLNAHQFGTVRTMAELILPRTETPGATDVGASEFIDLMLTEWYDERDRTRFANGLADVDVRTTALFGKNFVDASPAQQAEILSALGESMAGNAGHARDPEADSASRPDADFYPMLRQLTLNAYYTSEAGATQELHFEVIPDSHDGCALLPSAKGPEN
jgi:glucoside 3-dehydrogenase (cytochrome c) hitch-hiker subunit